MNRYKYKCDPEGKLNQIFDFLKIFTNFIKQKMCL